VWFPFFIAFFSFFVSSLPSAPDDCFLVLSVEKNEEKKQLHTVKVIKERKGIHDFVVSSVFKFLLAFYTHQMAIQSLSGLI